MPEYLAFALRFIFAKLHSQFIAGMLALLHQPQTNFSSICVTRSSLRSLLAVSVMVLAACAAEPTTESSQPELAAPTPLPAPTVAESSAVEVATPSPVPATDDAATNRNIELVATHPERYVVVPRDTLWDIAARFLEDPWVWPEIWEVNPQIGNPHLIYPGDIISLAYVDGRPVLRVDRPGGAIAGDGSTTKVSPRIRSLPLDQAIPSISPAAVEQFTTQPLVITQEEFEAAPYILGNDDGHLISAAGNRIYARGIDNQNETLYSIYRRGGPFIDPDTDEQLGYEAVYVGDGRITAFGDPATLLVTDSSREAINGDRLFPQDRGRIRHNYVPRAPITELNGKIISLFDAISQTGRSQIIVINIGQRDGLEVGDILAIEQSGGTVRDVFKKGKPEDVELPTTRAGIMMTFRTFERVSYGLIMKSTRPIKLFDLVTNP